MTSAWRTEAHCYKIWRFHKPQWCFTALAPERKTTEKVVKSETVREQTEQIRDVLPQLDFQVCPEGNERMLGIARIRDLLNTK